MVAMDVNREEVQQENGISSPRISFSCDLADDARFISINPEPAKADQESEDAKQSSKNFEFSSSDRARRDMPTADELFFEGKLLPYWQTHHSEKLKTLSFTSSEMVTAAEITAVKAEEAVTVTAAAKEESRVRTWFIDDDPSPRPPKCTVLWKELLKLKTRRSSSTLTPSSSSSSSSSDLDMRESNAGSKNVKRVKKGLEIGEYKNQADGQRPDLHVDREAEQ